MDRTGFIFIDNLQCILEEFFLKDSNTGVNMTECELEFDLNCISLAFEVCYSVYEFHHGFGDDHRVFLNN